MAWLRVSTLLLACLLVGTVVGVRATPARAAEPPPVDHPLKPGPGAPRPYSPTALPATAFSSPSQGYIPCDLANAYGLRNLPEQGQGVTIGIPDAFNQPNLEADLHQFDVTFGLPDPPSLNVIRQRPFGSTDQANLQGWQLETSMDVEYAHALAPRANIVVVLAPDAGRLWDSLPVLVQNGADLVSMSWGTGEFSGEGSFTPPPGPFYAAASGDNGHGTGWPAVLPQVASVGGTAVSSAATGHDTSGHTSCSNSGQPVTSATQTAWPGSGGGVSTLLSQPSYQQGVVSGYSQTRRVQNDTALDADPSTGVAVYSTAGYNQGVCDGGAGHYAGCTGFLPFSVGGTSLATPLLVASLAVVDEYRVAHGMPKVSSPADLYALRSSNANGFTDVTAGNNGACGFECNTAPGYDSVTGLGSPAVAAMQGPAPTTCALGSNRLAPLAGNQGLGGVGTSSVSAASWDRASRRDVFVRGSDGGLWHTSTSGGAYTAWEPLGGVLASGTGPAAAAWGPGRLDTFVQGTDHQLWHWYWSNGVHGWEPLGGYLTTSPTAASWGSGRLDVFVRGSTAGLFHWYWANGAYGWEANGGTLTSAPAASSWATNHLEIFAHGGSGIQELVWNNGWSGWTQFAASPRGDPAAASCAPGRVAAVDLDSSGAFRYLAYAGAWSGWNLLGTAGNGPGLVAASGNLDLYSTTAAGTVQHVQLGALPAAT